MAGEVLRKNKSSLRWAGNSDGLVIRTAAMRRIDLYDDCQVQHFIICLLIFNLFNLGMKSPIMIN
jgi:hypothetical protein